jgi:hypothetical protein
MLIPLSGSPLQESASEVSRFGYLGGVVFGFGEQ